MKFFIEKETRFLPTNNGFPKYQPIKTFYVWVEEDTKDYFPKTCFSVHQTESEAKAEIEIIKNIFPPKNEIEIRRDSIGTYIVRQTILDRKDGYTVKTVYNVTCDCKPMGSFINEEEAIQTYNDWLVNYKKPTESSIVYTETI